MNVTEKLEKVNKELEELHKQHKKLGNTISRKAELRDKLLLELNHENLKDPAWLFSNPSMPGSYEAINELFEKNYGGVYSGPHPSGYIQDEDYKPIQKNFDFWLKTYGDNSTKEKLKENCDHFVENYLPLLKPVYEIEGRWNKEFSKVNVVPFQFLSDEGGLDYLGYCPDDGLWYHYTMIYRHVDIKRVFESWNDAFEFAYAKNNVPETEDWY